MMAKAGLSTSAVMWELMAAWALWEAVQRTYMKQNIKRDKKIAADADAIFLHIHPKLFPW